MPDQPDGKARDAEIVPKQAEPINFGNPLDDLDERKAAFLLARGRTYQSVADEVRISKRTLLYWMETGGKLYRPEFASAVAMEQLEFRREIGTKHLSDAEMLGNLGRLAARALVKGGADGLVKRMEENPVATTKALAGIVGAQDRVHQMERRAAGMPNDAAVQVNVSASAVAGASATAGGPAEVPISATMDDFLERDMGQPVSEIYPRVLFLLRLIDRADVRRAYLMLGQASGKTVICETTLARQAQRLARLPNPARSYNLRSDEAVGVANLSGSGKEQAQIAIFARLRLDVERSPWFREHAPPDSSLKETISFPRNVRAASGSSRARAFEGVNFLASAVDEVCRMPEVEGADDPRAQDLVDPMEQTMLSRFPRDYKLLVVSWPEHLDDYLHQEIRKRLEREAVKEDLTELFLSSTLTRLPPAGEDARRAAIAEAPFADYPVRVVLTVDGTLVVQAPVWQMNPNSDLHVLRAENERDEPLFAKRHGANPKRRGANPYIRDLEAVKRGADARLSHPIGEDGRFLDWFKGNGSVLYYARVDIGITRDAAGLAVAHYEEGKIVYDLLLELRPQDQAGGEVNMAQLREIVYDMSGRGFTFGKVYGDTKEGQSQRQEFEAHGFIFEMVSVDRTKVAYDNWRAWLRDGKLRYYAYDPFFQCCESLIDMGNKVDHTPGGGKKDVTDAMAGLVPAIMLEVLGVEPR